jgi:GntR family transcriptional regulator
VLVVRVISRALGSSLHHQIQTVVRDGIATGRYALGDMLPTETEFCEMFSVSRITVRRAMDALEGEGLIARQRGRGTVVLSQKAETNAGPESDGFLRHLSAVLATTTASVLQFGLVAPPAEVMEVLQLSPTELCLRIVRIRHRQDLPILLTTMYLDRELADRTTQEDFASVSAASVLIKHGYEYHRVSYSAGAALADSITAGQLGVHIGSPLLDLQRVSIGRDNRPFEYMKLLGPPARFRFEVTMQQNDAGELTLISGP